MNTYKCSECDRETFVNSDKPELMSKCCKGNKPVLIRALGAIRPTIKHQMVVPLVEIRREAAKQEVPSLDVSGAAPEPFEEVPETEEGIAKYNQPKKAK